MNYKFKTKPYGHQITALEKSWNKEVFAYFKAAPKVCNSPEKSIFKRDRQQSQTATKLPLIHRLFRNPFSILVF